MDLRLRSDRAIAFTYICAHCRLPFEKLRHRGGNPTYCSTNCYHRYRYTLPQVKEYMREYKRRHRGA